MSINARCPACGEQFRRPDGLAGKLEKCPECHRVFRMPTVTTPPDDKARDPLPESSPPPPASPPVAPAAAKQGPDPTARLAPTPPSQAAPSPSVKTREPVAEVAAPPAPPTKTSPVAAAKVREPSRETPPLPAQPAKDAMADSAAATPKPPKLKTETNREPSAPVDFDPIVASAESICAGRSCAVVELDLFQRGLDTPDARQISRFLSEAYERLQEQRKQKKAVMWLSMATGILLIAVDLVANFSNIAQGSSSWKFLLIGCALVGVVLFFRGLWLFVAGPRPIRPEELIEAWDERGD